MARPILLLTSLLLLIGSCTTPPSGEATSSTSPKQASQAVLEMQPEHLLSGPDKVACCAYWTENATGQAILCWSESDTAAESYQMRFATYDAQSGRFGPVGQVPPSTGMQAHGESMAKMAFKSDGTAIAIFRRKAPTPENRFAGSVFYSLSTDGGQQWSPQQKLVKDPASQSQSFFDLARLKNGELGMIWLDGRRLDPTKQGSTLYFAATQPGGAFGPEVPIDGTTCQCCRTDLYATEDGNLHVAFRDILQDSIRDMVYLVSQDDGQHFSPPQTISPDNWVIDGCPHTGPSLARNAQGLGCAWYTQGGQPGVYFTLHAPDGAFAPRESVRESAAHPQLISLPEGQFGIVMEQLIADLEAPRSQVVLVRREAPGQFQLLPISAKEMHATFPVVHAAREGQLVVAWTQDTDAHSQIAFRAIDLASPSLP